MLTMDQYEFIRTGHRVYRKSIKQLQRETGHARNTIKRALKMEYLEYPERKSQGFPMLGEYHKTIDEWLKADKVQPKKQRHTARRVYNRLVDELGFIGCESNVRRYVREAKRRLGVGSVKVFIPLDPEYAREAEVDWGNGIAIIAERRMRIHIFCMRSRFSGNPFVCVYPCERQQVLFDAHMRAFEFFGGVFETLVYDNMTTVVKNVLRGKKRIEQESYKRFRSYYNYESRFCNLNSGHEKGGVEGLVGYSRRNFMVPIPEAATLAELNTSLLKKCLNYGNHTISGRDQTVNELFEQEKSRLICLPENPFNNIQITSGKTDHYSTVTIDRNRYSVPTNYAGLKVRVELSATTVTIFYGGKKIAYHTRVFGSGKWILEPGHYLSLIQQRPGAFHSARPIRQWREDWPESLENLLHSFQQHHGETGGIKDFISVLMLYKEHDPEDVNAAVELALETCVRTSDGVKHILLHSEPDYIFESLPNWPVMTPGDVSEYSVLGSVK